MSDTPVELTPISSGKLPLYLRERFELFSAKLFGRDWLLAVEMEDWDVGTPSEYRDQVKKLTNTLKKPVVLVLSALTSTMRNRLVQMNVPFVAPNSQIFLPVSLIDLRETFPRQEVERGRKLSPTAQVMVLHQILRGELESLSSKLIAAKLGYSEMGISKARSELEANQLCDVIRQGKEMRLSFTLSSRQLWEEANPLLRSPVYRQHAVKWSQPIPTAKLAGVSGLSLRSNLADDDIQTYAIMKRDFRHLLEQGEFYGCSDRHEADAWIETWSYNPGLLSDQNVVDELSLYLSLRYNPDERVQSELKAMMENFPWR
jgi:hypothetical protein